MIDILLIGAVMVIASWLYWQFIPWLRNDLKLRRMANEAHKNALLKSTIDRAYLALDQGSRVIYDGEDWDTVSRAYQVRKTTP